MQAHGLSSGAGGSGGGGIGRGPGMSDTTQMNQFFSYLITMEKPQCKDAVKLKVLQDITKNFELILSSVHYPAFIEKSMKLFLKMFDESDPHFIAEYNIQQVRKLMLELIYRFPTNEMFRAFLCPMMALTLKLLKIDNEENALLALKILMEMYKQLRPDYSEDIGIFLNNVKSTYSTLPSYMSKMFLSPKGPIKVKDLSELNVDSILSQAFSTISIQTEKKGCDGSTISYYLIPKAAYSLKVLQELPVIVVLLYQLFKQDVSDSVREFVPLIINTITLQPPLEQRQMDTFNREIFIDFIGAQIKTLSFLAYVIKVYQDVVKNHSNMVVRGLLYLFTLCPMEVCHLRKELLIAARHILSTDIKNKFVPYIEQLLDENILIGRGWTAAESLRPLGYSTLADLVHHTRHQLALTDIIKATNLFSKIIHDDSLTTAIHTMSCKLLLNLVDGIRTRSEENYSKEGRELLMRMLEVFVLKFKTVVQIHIPYLKNRFDPSKKTSEASATQPSVPPSVQTPVPEAKPDAMDTQENIPTIATEKETVKTNNCSSFIPTSPNYTVTDSRNLVKTLVCGVKTIAWGRSACKAIVGQNVSQARHFEPQDTLVFIRIIKWGMKALDIYTLNIGTPQTQVNQTYRNKEEKEVLEHFSGIFSMMNSQTFYEIFSTTIEYLVERVYQNPNLRTIPSTLLANPSTSPVFATILVEYLLEKMDEMGSNLERSDLYLRLFKLVFGSVSLFPQENESMLQPYLHKIVNRSMELAMTAAEPFNYFMLLRALFRSIGGGSHDLLYQDFLPLLPNLLESLNRLQSGLHKQEMKDLFVELCLTVPVRLSTLLPHLPMLMDPLVSALNGSPNLVSQGLRTLELCVDNLQHDFLYEHIQPVRAELIQALWRTLQFNDQAAQVSLKVLGKFGGGNRKMLTEPQKIEYIVSDHVIPSILTKFDDYPNSIEFPVYKIIETAFNTLKQSNIDPFYRKPAWEVINSYLTASRDLGDSKDELINLFLDPSFEDASTIVNVKGSHYKSVNTLARETHRMALKGMIVGSAIKELSQAAIQTFILLVRHYTMVAVAQQCGKFAHSPEPNTQVDLDPLVLVDALADIMGHEERELCKPGQVALVLIVDTATTLLGSKEKACRLPLIEYLSEKMCGLCYERAWYAKLGGCMAINFMVEKCALKWLYEHMYTFLKALLFVMMDLTGEVSSGALDMAKETLHKMLTTLVTPVTDENDSESVNLRAEALRKVTHELVRQITSPHTMVREQSMESLRLLAKEQNRSVTEVMEPFKDVLADMVPPKKHQLNHQPAIAQMGLMDGNMFCTTLEPRLFTIDMKIKEHALFISDLLTLCNMETPQLAIFPCYKNVTNFIPLKQSALRVLATCHYIEEIREQIFKVLYGNLEKPDPDLQKTAFECIKKFISGYAVEKELIHSNVRPLLMTLGDVKDLTLNGVKMLSYLTQLFPTVFNEKLCEQLLEILKLLLDNMTNLELALGVNDTLDAATSGESSSDTEQKQRRDKEHAIRIERRKKKQRKITEIEQKIVTIIGIFNQVPAASSKFIIQLTQFVMQTEQITGKEPSSPYRGVLIKFLLRYPTETINMFLDDNFIKNRQFSRLLKCLLKHPDGKPFRDCIQNSMIQRLLMLLHSNYLDLNMSVEDKNELQFQSIRIISLLIKYDEQWLSQHQDLVEAVKRIWCDDAYHEKQKIFSGIEYNQWKEPKLITKILLNYFTHNIYDIDVLFQLLRATLYRFVADFRFLREFLENTVAHTYTIEWKRAAFFHFVETFASTAMAHELKAKIIQLILTPAFYVSFDKGETNQLIGSSPMPYDDNPENVVSVFINKLIDPENPHPASDSLRIALLQFSCLLVDQASPHIHDANNDSNNKPQGFKLRRLMTFAWPCLLVENCVDPVTKYHGHLLISHIIGKFAIHRKIVLQVFHSLLRAHVSEARYVVRQALEILTPAMPFRMEKGYEMLAHWTKKILIDEGHSIQQLYHILQILVRHYKVYYRVRHELVPHMATSIHRLAFSPTCNLDQRKLSVEVAEVIIKWELFGVKDESNQYELMDVSKKPQSGTTSIDNDLAEGVRRRLSMMQNTGGTAASNKNDPIGAPGHERLDKRHTDLILNFFLRFACQIYDMVPQSNTNNQTGAVSSLIEALSRRCVAILRLTLKPELWHEPYELKLSFLDKVLGAVETPNSTGANVAIGLEILTFLLSVYKTSQILATIRILQGSLILCLQSPKSKIIKLMHNFLIKLFAVVPLEKVNKYEELEILYPRINTFILENLNTYEEKKPSTLLSTVMVLKAACTYNPSYIDSVITLFMRVLQKLTKEHCLPSTKDSIPATSELLILSLDLVKTRIVVMGVDMRKVFIGTILVGLMEKTQDIKVMKAITKMLDEWMKCKNPITLNQTPSAREKSILLVKLMQYVEKRFSDDNELNAQFLELVNYVYTDKHLRTTELTSKLEPAFMAGLRCTQPHIRAKFFKVFDESIRRHLQERLLYIVCTQNWEMMGSHYWIKQIIEIILVTSTPNIPIRMSHPSSVLPRITSVIGKDVQLSEDIKKCFMEQSSSPNDVEMKDVFDLNLPTMDVTQSEENPVSRAEGIKKMINTHFQFIELSHHVATDQFLLATAQLCHMDTNLAENVWLNLFPNLWNLLDEEEQALLAYEIRLFIMSGTHVIQKDCQLSALNTFIEALMRCNPQIQIEAPVMKYLGKSHNLWHRMALTLEQQTFEPYRSMYPSNTLNPEINSQQTEIRDCLNELYQEMCEEDLWAGLWQKHAMYKETNVAIALEQHGFFEQAQTSYLGIMSNFEKDLTVGSQPPETCLKEIKMVVERYIRCSKELQLYEQLMNFANPNGSQFDPLLLLECAWKTRSWDLMRVSLNMIEQDCPKEMSWKVALFNAYLVLYQRDEVKSLLFVEKYVDKAMGLCLSEWRRLPHIVSHAHIKYLQAAQQIIELQEAYQIHKAILQETHTNHTSPNFLIELRAIGKTWCNRLPVIADDLVHWSDIYTWRQLNYYTLLKHYEPRGNDCAQYSKIAKHGSAEVIVTFSRIARKHKLPNVCLQHINQIYHIATVSITDCFQKMKQQIKSYIQLAATNKNILPEALNAINQTNMQYFTKESTGEFHALTGSILQMCGKSNEAYHSFAKAIEQNNESVNAWGLFGDYMESLFIKDPREIRYGKEAMACFLQASHKHYEPKSRKYIAKILWLLSYEDNKNSLINVLEKFTVLIPPNVWLPWTSQLLNCLLQYEGNVILNLLCQIGRVYPQAVYFPVRILYLTLRTATARKTNTVQNLQTPQEQQIDTNNPDKIKIEPSTSAAAATPTTSSAGTSTTEASSIRATPAMVQCSKIMKMQRDLHTTVISSLEGIADQMEWFRENWYEEVLRQLCQGLTKCYTIAFEKRDCVNEAKITAHILNFVKKLMSTFGIGVENITSSVNVTFNSAASESLARRAEATYQDPVFLEMKADFKKDFDFSQSNSMRLHNLIFKLKKWIKVLDNRSKMMLQSFLIEEKCRFLSNFTLKTAEVELPGEFLLPKHSHYFVRITRFMPRVDVLQKHNAVVRRLYIRGHNGRIYPYLVVNDSGLADARREERVLQMLRMMNMYLGKQKETSKRFLNFTVPRVVAVSQQIRLVEDNPASISYLDIFKKDCNKLGKQGVDHDDPIQYYYERLSLVQKRNVNASHQIYRDIFKTVQEKMVPKVILKNWALQTFPSATDYWHFRKIFTLQMALACFAEYVFHLTRLNPDMMYLHQDSGLMNISYFKFDVDDATGELDQTRPVPFRLTPNIIEYLSPIGVCGPLTASMIATARCLVYPNFKLLSILRPILRDEMILSRVKKGEDNISNHEKLTEAEQIISMVGRAINSISNRLNSLAHFDGTDSKVATLVQAANSPDNLCRMDPAWHPWL